MQATFLKRVFAFDAATGFASFVLLVLGAEALAPLLGLSAGFLSAAGWLLLPVAGLFAFIATRAVPPTGLVWLGIIGNLGWVIASFAVLGLLDPTPLGVGFVVAQALAVLLLAWLEYRGVTRARVAA